MQSGNFVACTTAWGTARTALQCYEKPTETPWAEHFRTDPSLYATTRHLVGKSNTPNCCSNTPRLLQLREQQPAVAPNSKTRGGKEKNDKNTEAFSFLFFSFFEQFTVTEKEWGVNRKALHCRTGIWFLGLIMLLCFLFFKLWLNLWDPESEKKKQSLPPPPLAFLTAHYAAVFPSDG